MTSASDSRAWYKDWFDSPYYHILYKNRDHEEAQLFLDHLIAYLQPDPQANILDLACGKGRHATYLHQKGFSCTGVDLSPANIQAAQENCSDVRFAVHDIREVFEVSAFDFILNLFTSFGYFENDADHVQVMKAVSTMLKPQSTFVIDFMNAELMIKQLVPSESKEIEGIQFQIEKAVVDGRIIKTIQFAAEGKAHRYEERVSAFSRAKMHEMLDAGGLELTAEFGDYDLGAFDAEVSPRLILLAKKR